MTRGGTVAETAVDTIACNDDRGGCTSAPPPAKRPEPSKPAAKTVASPTPLPNVAPTVNLQDKRVALLAGRPRVPLGPPRGGRPRPQARQGGGLPGEAALRVAQHREGPQERVRVARADLVIDKINKTGLGIIARLDNQRPPRQDLPRPPARRTTSRTEGLRPGVRRAVQGEGPDLRDLERAEHLA